MNEGLSNDFGVREKMESEQLSERENEAREYRHVTHIQAEHVLSAMDHLCEGSNVGFQLPDLSSQTATVLLQACPLMVQILPKSQRQRLQPLHTAANPICLNEHFSLSFDISFRTSAPGWMETFWPYKLIIRLLWLIKLRYAAC